MTLADGTQVQETIELPPLSVAVASILAIAPGSQSVEAGETAAFDVTVTNPSGGDATIGLTFAGIPGALVTLPSEVFVPANDSIVVPLQIAPAFDATPALEAFAITASFPGGGSQTASAELLVEAPDVGAPVVETRAVSLSIVGSGASAGPGTTATAPIPGADPIAFARPSLRVANLGTEVQTYDLALTGPAGWSASLDRTQVVVAPGLVNAIDVPITLVAPLSVAPGSVPYSATATDVASPGSNDTAAASVAVVGPGLTLELTPPTGAPGGSFELDVTNTGDASETFDLSLGGSVAAVTTGLPATLTLPAGGSTTIPLEVGTVDFLLPGGANLVVRATAQTQPGVFAQAQALLTIEATRGLGIVLTPAAQALDALDPVTLEVVLENQGTLEDRVEIRIVDTTGPVSASLRSALGNGLRVGGARLPAGALGVLGLDVTPLGEGPAAVTVEVRSELDGGISASDTAAFTIALPQPPSAVISAPAEIPFGATVVLDGTGSSDPDGGPAPLSFAWELLSVPSGSALVSLVDGTDPVASFDPDLRGSYEVSLTVSDGLFEDTATATIEVVNNAPTADAGPDQNVETGTPAALDASGSFDPDGDLLSYGWSFVSLPPASALTDLDLSDPAAPMPGFTPDVDGDYEVGLVVNDGFELAMDTVVVSATTANVPPNADAGPQRSALVGLATSVDGSASDDPDAGPQALAYAWRFAAVPTGSGLVDADLVGADGVVASFVPDAEGDFLLELTVDDGDASDIATVLVVAALNAAPMADAGDDREVIVERSVQLDGSASSDPDDAPDALSYAWRFVSVAPGSALTEADINGAASARPTVTFDVVGTYVLELEVFDGLANDFDNVAITVIGAQQMVHYETANEQSVLDPFTRIVTSTADLQVRNDGTQRLRAPWQLAFEVPAGVALVDADGIDGSGRPFYDLEARTGSVELRPGETLVVPVAFEHAIGVAFTYDVEITELSAQLAPQQTGTACGLHAEQALFLPLWFAFRRFWRRRRAAAATTG